MATPRPRLLLGAVAVLGVLAAAQFALLAFERSDPGQFTRPDPGVPSLTPPTSSPARPSFRQPELLPLDKDERYWKLLDRIEKMIATYRDQPLYADADYNLAFLSLVSDQRGALRFEAGRTGTREVHTEILDRYTREIDLLEKLYTSGEPLGSDVHIRREDGSEFTYDGDTAPRDS